MRNLGLLAVLVLVVWALSGCVRTRSAQRDENDERVLTPKGRQVRLMKADPPLECRDLGSVSASVNGLASQQNVEEAKVSARNKAGLIGADYLRLESLRFNAVSGTAFYCRLPAVDPTPTKTATGPAEDHEKVLTAQGKLVRVMKSDPPFECREVGQVAASISGFISQENQDEALVVARNRTAAMGADCFRMDGERPNAVMGTAFRCAPPAQTTAAATRL